MCAQNLYRYSHTIGFYAQLGRGFNNPVDVAVGRDGVLYVLNRAIVVAEIDGAEAGIRALEQAGRAGSLSRYHLYDATLGELYRRLGDFAEARHYLETAKQKTTAPSDHEIINRRLARCK